MSTKIALGAHHRDVAEGVAAHRDDLVQISLPGGVIPNALQRHCLQRHRPFDPVFDDRPSVTLIVVAVIACALPAWRPRRIDPIQALRSEYRGAQARRMRHSCGRY
ncbi:MAG: hypothetical protein ABJD11_13905 [Gemmatimonadota bacterium]